MSPTRLPSQPSEPSAGGRQSADFHPDIWGDYFIKNYSETKPNISGDGIKERVDELIQQIKKLLGQPDDLLQKMELIYALHRSGVDYHFEEEIAEALEIINNNMASEDDVDDLYMIALRFLLLRQNRCIVATSVFDKFKDENGNFKDSLSSDVRGLLALYEASYLSMPGEEILDKAKNFARHNLNLMLPRLEPSVAKRVKYSLERTPHRRMRRLDARHYISFYENDTASRHDPVLELAKFDFHILQLLHREEIGTVSMHYKESGIGVKLKFARDRSVECYIWALGIYYEPKHSSCRLMIAKFINLLSFMDDIYDVYATSQELILFTDVIQRWDVEAANNLEDHLKLPFLALNDLINDIEKKLASNGKYNYTSYLKDALKQGFMMQHEESKWRDDNFVPPLEEYLHVRGIATLYKCIACAAFLCDGEAATPAILEWMTSTSKIILAMQSHCRILDDIVSYEKELKRKHVTTAVQCYMKEHNSSTEVAIENLLVMVEDIWEVFNQEYIRRSLIPKALLEILLNLVRAMETFYRGIDRYTESYALKDHVTLLLNHPIPL